MPIVFGPQWLAMTAPAVVMQISSGWLISAHFGFEPGGIFGAAGMGDEDAVKVDIVAITVIAVDHATAAPWCGSRAPFPSRPTCRRI